jgi:hypothetical protein
LPLPSTTIESRGVRVCKPHVVGLIFLNGI